MSRTQHSGEVVSGIYTAFRKNGEPTFYEEQNTPFRADILESGLIFAGCILALSFLYIIPGFNGKSVRMIQQNDVISILFLSLFFLRIYSFFYTSILVVLTVRCLINILFCFFLISEDLHIYMDVNWSICWNSDFRYRSNHYNYY